MGVTFFPRSLSPVGLKNTADLFVPHVETKKTHRGEARTRGVCRPPSFSLGQGPSTTPSREHPRTFGKELRTGFNEKKDKNNCV